MTGEKNTKGKKISGKNMKGGRFGPNDAGRRT